MYVIERADGSQLELPEKPSAEHQPFTRYAKVPRPQSPDGIERWNFDSRRWVPDPARAEAWINQRHRFDRGDHSIEIAQHMKALEARIMLAGLVIDGLVAAEARATGQDPLDLASAIVAKAVETERPEIDRIVARRAARAT